jgi:MFS family permease
MIPGTLPNDFRAIREPRTGPRTGDQMAALGELERLAGLQAEPVTRELPAYTGPVTGEFSAAAEHAAAERADLESWLDRIARDHNERQAPALRPPPPPPRGRPRLPRVRVSRRQALPAVLLVQAVLSLRLAWSNTAFLDEADYIYAGHLEWAHWLHGAPVPSFQAYFSGAPVIYPPLAAIADTLGGLAGARLLSLAFMLGTSALLWLSAGRLYGRRAAYLSTALFAGLTGTQFLGALATYDAMALFLLAAAAYLAVRGVTSRHWLSLSLAAGVLLASANAAKYATGIFDPAVIALAAAIGLRGHRGIVRALRPAALLAVTAGAAIAAAVRLGGHAYWLGITSTTTARPGALSAPDDVVKWAWIWTGPVILLAACAVLASLKGGRRAWLIPAILLAAGLLVPAEQARIRTMTSLNKHVVLGAWFAAIGAGYALSRASLVDRSRVWALVLAVPAAGMVAFATFGQAAGMYHGWGNTSAIMADLQPLVRSHPGTYLADDPEIPEYYLRSSASWQQWRGTYAADNDGAPYYRETIGRHYFSLIILANLDSTRAADHLIITDIYAAGGYRMAARADGYTVWERK